MVGEEVLKQSCEINTLQEGAGEKGALKSKEDFELRPHSDVREWLGATRRLHGPESPIGNRCTNLLELLESLTKEPDRDTRANILKSIDRQKADLERLLRE